ncbi:hypothetical protein ABIA31_008023 [Catenulispora sp. MAP5-51]|uniref:hypothetical protein n=1 Tax=Catenulispora sp. MAP5-51 TaxID=3156298 RepID=UPI003515C760
MNKLIRLATVLAGAGALALPTAAVSNAASARPADAACVVVNGSNAYGTGTISLCPQSDGTTHATGNITPLLHSDWIDNNCIAWDVLEGPTHSQLETTVCPGPAGTTNVTTPFDFSFTPEAAITGAQIVHVDV